MSELRDGLIAVGLGIETLETHCLILRKELKSAFDGFVFLQRMYEEGNKAEGEADKYTTHRPAAVSAHIYAATVQEVQKVQAALNQVGIPT